MGASPSSARRSRSADDIRLDGRPIRTRAAAAAQLFLFNRSPGDPLRESDAERAALIERLPKSAGPPLHRREPHAGHRRRARARHLGRRPGRKTAARHPPPACEFTRARASGLLGPDQLAGVKSGKLDRPARMDIESVSHQRGGSSKAPIAGTRWWREAPAARTSASCSRGRVRWSAACLRVAIGATKLDKSLARGQFRQLDRRRNRRAAYAPAPENAGP